MLDARIASALKKIITNTYFKKKASLGEQKAQMPEVLVLQNSRMEHRKKPRNKNDAPAEKHGIWRNMSISSMTRTKPRSSHLHEVRSLPVPSLKRPEEREFVVDPGASMHVLNRTDLNSAELETKRVSRNPTTVITATRTSANSYTFTARSSSWRYKSSRTRLQSCRQANSATHEWASGQKPNSTNSGKVMQHGELCTDCCPRIIDSFFQLECQYLLCIVTAGHMWWYFVESSNNT